MAENEVKDTASVKLNSYIEKNRTCFVVVLAVVVVALIAFIIGVNVTGKAKANALQAIDEITFTLTDGSGELEEAELNARRIDALDNLANYVNKGGIVGARANMLCAELTFQQKKYEDAASYWSAAASKAKKSYIAPLAYYNMAASYEQLNKLDDAAANYKLAADSEGFTLTTHAKFSYGRVLETQGKIAEAVAAYTELNDKYPNDTWAKLAKTRILTLKAEGKAE